MAYDVEGAYERWLQNILNIRYPCNHLCFTHCKHWTVDFCTKTSNNTLTV